MASARHVIWNNEKIGPSPARRTVIFKYPEVEKVLLSFSIDLAVGGSSRSYLDPSKPITVNGKLLRLPDLQSDPTSLRVVERSDIDITPLVASSALGVENVFEVNYILGDRSLLKRQAGNLSLTLSIITPERKMVRFCFFCGAPNGLGAKQCVRCGKLLEVGGMQTTVCTKCGETIPLRSDVRFCDKCGTLQETATPEPGRTKSCKNCGAAIDADAVFCSKCGTPQ
jgi:ribosomal protein L40E